MHSVWDDSAQNFAKRSCDFPKTVKQVSNIDNRINILKCLQENYVVALHGY